MQIDQLPDDVLAEVFKRLDIRSRVQCESVSRRFRSVAENVYSSEWKDIPRGTKTLVISAWCLLSDVLWDREKVEVSDSEVRILVLSRREGCEGEKRKHEWFAQLLRSILAKFVYHFKAIELHNADMDSSTLNLLLMYQDRIPSLKCFNCRFTSASVIDAANFFSVYDGGVVVKGDCSCSCKQKPEKKRVSLGRVFPG